MRSRDRCLCNWGLLANSVSIQHVIESVCMHTCVGRCPHPASLHIQWTMLVESTLSQNAHGQYVLSVYTSEAFCKLVCPLVFVNPLLILWPTVCFCLRPTPPFSVPERIFSTTSLFVYGSTRLLASACVSLSMYLFTCSYVSLYLGVCLTACLFVGVLVSVGLCGYLWCLSVGRLVCPPGSFHRDGSLAPNPRQFRNLSRMRAVLLQTVASTSFTQKANTLFSANSWHTALEVN